MTDSGDTDEDVFATDIDDVEDEIEAEGNTNGASGGGAAGAVLEFVAKSIVDDPDSVRIETETDRRGLTLRLHVAPDDMGKVIGKGGRTAKAIRAVVRAAATRQGTSAYVDIAD